MRKTRCLLPFLLVAICASPNAALAQSIVTIPDPNLEAAIRDQFGKWNDPLTTADMEALVYGYFSYRYITDVTGLEYASNLATLYLAGNTISNVNALASLPALTNLDLSYCSLTDAAPLISLTNLVQLNLNGNPISNWAGLCSFTNLTALRIGFTSFVEPARLSCLTNLTTLDLSWDTVNDVAPLSGLPHLNDLSLDGVSLGNCSFLAILTNLTSLHLGMASITNIDGLASMSRLEILSLNDDFIADLSPLSNLGKLTSLDLAANKFTNCSALAALTNLVFLGLDDNRLEDVTCLQGLNSLRTLGLSYNHIRDLGVIESLTNLTWLDLRYNRLTNIANLPTLPRFSSLSLTGNLLDLSPGSSTMNSISNLQGAGVHVDYSPQNQAPSIFIENAWVIAPNAAASMEFWLGDDDTPADLVSLVLHSSNQQLVTDAQLSYTKNGLPSGASPFSYQGYDLNVLPSSNQTGTCVITVTATDDAGLTNTASILVQISQVQFVNAAVLDATNFVWRTAGLGPWFEQTNVSHLGGSAAQSGGPGSWLETVATGPGTLTFWWKTAPGSNAMGDFEMKSPGFPSLVGGLTIPGGTDWRQETVGLSSGAWTLTWKLRANDPGSADTGTIWVDHVSFVPGTPPCWIESTQAPRIGGLFTTPEFVLHGELGAAYDIEASSDLVNWTRKGTVTMYGLAMLYSEPGVRSSVRFYRMHRVATGSAFKIPSVQ